jgi:hypothetical protein
MEKYTINTSKGPVHIEFESIDEIKFRMEGPKEIISSVVAGLGDEDTERAWVTEKHLKTEETRMYALLEVIKLSSKFPSTSDLVEDDLWKDLTL